MTNNGKWMIITSLALVVILVLVVVLAKESAPPVPFYDLAEQHEKNEQWELERAAWFMAMTRVGPPSTRGEIGRKAYYEYRIGITYKSEGRLALAIVHLQNALDTPASEINAYVGANGTEEMQKDLDDLLGRASQRKRHL